MQAKLAAPPPRCYCKIFAQLNFQLKIFGSVWAAGGWPRLRLTLTVSCLHWRLQSASAVWPPLVTSGMSYGGNKQQAAETERFRWIQISPSLNQILVCLINSMINLTQQTTIAASRLPSNPWSRSPPPLPPTSLVHKYHSKHKFEHKRHKMFAKSALGCGEYNLLDKYEFANFLP